MKDTSVSVQHVSKTYGSEQVLRDVCHEFAPGMIHGIVGNNGSGKTMLFKCICGFVQPDAGRVLVGSDTIGKDVDFPTDTGAIIETPGFLPRLSGFQNLMLLASLRRKIGQEDVRKTMVRVGLHPDLKKHVGGYSLGMRQRLGIAQAIMENPSLLILDEPFNGLDRAGVVEMRSLLRELNRDGATVLMASHNAGDIEELCDTVCEMDAGVLTEKPRTESGLSSADM